MGTKNITELTSDLDVIALDVILPNISANSPDGTQGWQDFSLM